MAKKSIIKDSSNIRAVLKKRLAELGLSNVQVAIEAERFGQKNVNSETLSRYFKGNSLNSLTEESIVYLVYRYGIPIKLVIGHPVKVENGEVKCTLPKYDENQCIKNLREICGIETIIRKDLPGVENQYRFRKSRMENAKKEKK